MSNTTKIRSTEEALFAAQKLKAMTIAITGEGFEHFQTMSEDSQHWYLMALSDMASEVSTNLAQ